MSNLPMVPGVPSSGEVDAMKRAMQALSGNVPAVYEQQAQYSGGSAGVRQPLHENTQPYMPSYGTSAEDVAQMKNILERLNAINGDESGPQMLTESQGNHRGGYHVVETIVEANGQQKPAFNVMGGSVIAAESLSLKEAADAISKYLNKGLAVDSAKVQEVIQLEETYYRNRIEAGVIKSRYQRATQLGETESADVFKSRFNKVKAEALLASDQIKSILASIR